ncbi:MAG: type II toxin-antitoxin system ParD family antitoxin [Accumulibacter sp.]|jgi:antitoxin ParD1/3/4|uniref:type II toxin-antitoxin system ParD family antitoxin n=1 Tax=Accumulibacter sp. TaxID=2053492 RepID=UPI001DCE83BA|nr:type II toxin-antitoxin system ParD family antitoxin [Candidatus Competibacteraceae bacterium]HPE74120.1 type II toxin-antitoxin system ParD family antitoxin [Candidatus Competibacter sp.]HRW67708.1 type II toxin-antitoxin system ParD family antitoxin [Candidatus Competibacter sp.]
MPNVEKVSIALTPEMAAVVRQAVESGDYASNSEIVREALRDWKLKRALQQQEVEELRRLWQEGLHSGPSRFAGMADLKAEARRRLEAQSQPGA